MKNPSAGRSARLRRALPLALTALALLAPVAAADGPEAGSVQFMRGAESSFDVYSSNPTASQQQWMRDHYTRMRTYAPYFNARLAWFPDAWTYKDAYAIYPGSTGGSGQDRFILRDAAGNRLYIPWGCGNGTCPPLTEIEWPLASVPENVDWAVCDTDDELHHRE